MQFEHSAIKTVSRTVLVVDDDPDIRSLTCTFLEHEGYAVHTSGDAARAAQLFRNSPRIDLVITDYSMPDRSGIELAMELKSLRPSLPVLIISGAILASDQLQQMETQGWNFLAKPFSLPQLLASVHTILRLAQAQPL